MAEVQDFKTLINPGGRKVEVPNAEADALLADPNSGYKLSSGRAIAKANDKDAGKLPAEEVNTAQNRVAVANKEEGTQSEDLMELSRADLNNVASDLGVEFPEKLPNKEAVVAAINEKRSGDASGDTPGTGDQEDQE